MQESLLLALSIDLIVLFACTYLLFRYAKLSVYHPAPTYLAFHIFTFSSRLLFLLNGANVFLGQQSDYFSSIENYEIVRATLLADIGFIAMTIAWILEADRQLTVKINQSKPVILIDNFALKIILCFTIPIGIWGIFSQLYIPILGKFPLDLGIWNESSYIANTQNWLILSYLILVFQYGFKKSYLIIIGISIFILAFQGQHRYRILTPCIFLLMLYIFRQKKRWLPFRFVVLILLGMIIFMPMKYVGKLIQQGASLSDLIEFASEYHESFGLGANADFSFLDMYSSILTLIDQHDHFYYGSTYFTLLLAPIPRPFWEAKPSLMQWMTDISTPTRNLRELGAIATIYGESYANFGYLGIIVIPFIFAKYSARWYYKILNTHHNSANLYLYLYFNAIIVQVYRDGLNAIFMFLSVYNMPGFFVWFVSVIKAKMRYNPIKK